MTGSVFQSPLKYGSYILAPWGKKKKVNRTLLWLQAGTVVKDGLFDLNGVIQEIINMHKH